MEFRLKYLNNCVDRLIIVESIYTFSENKKDGLYYNIHKHIFEKYKEKVFFYSINNLPTKIDSLFIRKNNILLKIINHGLMKYINEIIYNIYNDISHIKPFIIFVCDVDEIPNKQLYMNVKDDYDLLHEGAHLEMLLLNHGFKRKKENCIWRHPFVITDKGNKNLSFSNVRLTRTEKTYYDSGWHISYCFEIDDIIRKLESFAHTEYNKDKY